MPWRSCPRNGRDDRGLLLPTRRVGKTPRRNRVNTRGSVAGHALSLSKELSAGREAIQSPKPIVRVGFRGMPGLSCAETFLGRTTPPKACEEAKTEPRLGVMGGP